MKTIAGTLGLLILSIFICNNSLAQKASYTTLGGWTVGFGGGAAYQKSDLINSKGFGLDFIVGSQLYRKENSFFSVDWKFRFLAGQNKAFDHRINPDGTYSNIRYSFFTYDLELGLTLNRLRERTGIVLSGFAGAGLTHGRTFTDLYDTGGNLYEFSSINPDRNSKLVYTDLVALSDGDFETSLVNKVAILPTAGVFAGYQLSRSITIGVEFKTNFYLTEENSLVGIDLDNRIMDGSGIDRNNYISLGLRWNLRGGSSRMGSARTQVVQVSSPPPSVQITEPSGDGYQTQSPNQIIRATIEHVNGPEGISFLRNGFPVNIFTYNPSTNDFVANVKLRDGENRFIIRAANHVATAEDAVVITLDNVPEPVIPAPADAFIYPSGNQHASPPERVYVTAGVTNPSYPAEVSNNLSYSNYGRVSAGPQVADGVNTIEIDARSAVRDDAKDQVPIRETRPCSTPVIRLTEPARGQISTRQQSYRLTADVLHITDSRQLKLSVNGKPVSYTLDKNEMHCTVQLVRGNNSLSIRAVNECGEDHATARITYNPSVVAATNDSGTDTQSGSVAIEEIEEKVIEEVKEESLGIRINPGNSAWQFCLATPSGIFSRENLTNSDFSYSGAASSLYFMPIGGGGNAMVNGQPYTIKSGQYYLFTGSMRVTVSTSNPGAMGQWSLIISASRAPESGNGNKRPKSPCEQYDNEKVDKTKSNTTTRTSTSNNRDNRTNNNQDNKTKNNQDNKTKNNQDNKTKNNQDNKTKNNQDNKTKNNQDNKTKNNQDNKTPDNKNNRSRR